MQPYIPQGWQCPQCKSIYSPTVTKCWTCQPNTGATSGVPNIVSPIYSSPIKGFYSTNNPTSSVEANPNEIPPTI